MGLIKLIAKQPWGNYFILCGMQSLQTLLVAHHEHNFMLPLYHIFGNMPVENLLADITPGYYQRIRDEVLLKVGNPLVKEKEIQYSFNYQILDQDKKDLDKLQNDIKTILTELNLRPKFTGASQLFALYPFIQTIIGLASLYYSFKSLLWNNEEYHKANLEHSILWKQTYACFDEYSHNYKDQCLSLVKKTHEAAYVSLEPILLFSGLTIIILGLIAITHYWFKSHPVKLVDNHTWKNVVDVVKKHLLPRLHELEFQNNLSAVGLSASRIIELHINELNHHLSVPSGTANLMVIKGHVKNLRKEMNRSGQPLFLFFQKPRSRIEMTELSDTSHINLAK